MIKKTLPAITTMVKLLAIGLSFVTPLNAEPQKPGEEKTGPNQDATLSKTDTESLMKLARPSAQQQVWHDYEVGMFIHFGPNTFLDADISSPKEEYRAKGVESHYGKGPEFDPMRFNPDKLDTDQWVAAAEAMGAQYIVLVAKHHDGFCLWQTETSEYSIRNTPWKNGKGDIVAELSRSCRKRDMALGVYLSPQDHGFGASGGGGCRTEQDQERYNKVYRQQLTELLTRYGRMAEVWFDGGLVVPVSDIIQKHAPDAVVFQGPAASIRWVGNESGFAPYPAWNAISKRSARSGRATAKHGRPDGAVWMPNECDPKIRSKSFWMTNNANSLKSLDVLMDTYYRSVGHGAVLLLNQNPDRSGQIPDQDFKRGAEFAAEVRRRFGKSLAQAKGRGKSLTLDLKGGSLVDHVITMEDIAHGERIRSYRIEGFVDGAWIQLCAGTAVGHKKIDRFEPVRMEKIRLTVSESVGSPMIRDFSAYHTAASPTHMKPNPANAKRITLTIPANVKGGTSFDLSAQIKDPGQYTLTFNVKDKEALPKRSNLRLLIDGRKASEYLTESPNRNGQFNLNITVTRTWKKGSVIVRYMRGASSAADGR